MRWACSHCGHVREIDDDVTCDLWCVPCGAWMLPEPSLGDDSNMHGDEFDVDFSLDDLELGNWLDAREIK